MAGIPPSFLLVEAFAAPDSLSRTCIGRIPQISLIVATTKIFFEPDVEADEKITATHFLDFKFGGAGPAITPGNRDNRPGVTAYDCF